jgi:hypothetical protein
MQQKRCITYMSHATFQYRVSHATGNMFLFQNYACCCEMAEIKAERPKKKEQEMDPEEISLEETPRTDTVATMGKAGATVKEGVLSSLKGINEIETQIVTLVRNTVSDTLKATCSVADETVNVTKEVLQGTLKAVEEVGTGLLLSSKSVAKGVIMGVNDVGGNVLSVAKQVIKGTVNEAAEIGGDVGQVSRRTVDGIIEAARETGANAEELAKVTVNGAIEAAGSIGNTAVKVVRDVLVNTVEGVKDIAGAILADIASSLRQVFSMLQELQKAEIAGTDVEITQPAAEAAPEIAAPKLSPTKLAAKSPSKAMKKRGLPEKLVKVMEAKGHSKAEATTVPVSSGPEAETVKKTRKRTLQKKKTA